MWRNGKGGFSSPVLISIFPLVLISAVDQHGICDIWQMPGILNVRYEVGYNCKLNLSLANEKGIFQGRFKMGLKMGFFKKVIVLLPKSLYRGKNDIIAGHLG